MSSFHATLYYNPLIVLFLGLITFTGWFGIGKVILATIRVHLPQPWNLVLAVLSGLQFSALVIFLLAASGIAFIPVLITWFCLTLVPGFLYLQKIRLRALNPFDDPPRGPKAIPLILTAAAMIVNLLAAMAPSSKIDELYYHMILPSRIVSDHQLLVYHLPWESAVWPHMIYQIALTPLHAMGFPDAGNIASWLFNSAMVWFGLKLVQENREHRVLVYTLLACFVTGIYPVVWDVTNGPYAFGELATAAAIVALLTGDQLEEKAGNGAWLLLVSMLTLIFSSSKILMLPLAASIIIYLIFKTIHKERTIPGIIRGILIILLPWIMLYLPFLVVTFAATGSPFGPVLAGLFGIQSQWDPKFLHLLFSADKLKNYVTFYILLENFLIYYPVIFWIAVLSFFCFSPIRLPVRLTAFGILCLHSVVLCIGAIYDPRFYNGIIQGLILILLMSLTKDAVPRGFIQNKVVRNFLFLLLLPWLSLQIFYAWSFFGVSTGFQSKEVFYEKTIAMYSDYIQLDKLLPADAYILIMGDTTVRLNSVYLPRPICFTESDLPERKNLYLLTINHSGPVTVKNMKVGEAVYQNLAAKTIIFRDRIRKPVRGTIRCYELER